MADSRNNYHAPPDYTARQMTSPVAETSIPRNPPPSYDSLARNSTPIQPTQTAPSHNSPLQPNVHPPLPHAPPHNAPLQPNVHPPPPHAPPHNATPHGVPRRFTSTAAAPANNSRPTDPLSSRPGDNSRRYYGSLPEWTDAHNWTSAPYNGVNAANDDLVLLGVPRREYEAALARQQWRANCLRIRLIVLCVFIVVVIIVTIVFCVVVSSNSGDDSGDDGCGTCSLIGDTCYC